jgi:hypothetical protein
MSSGCRPYCVGWYFMDEVPECGSEKQSCYCCMVHVHLEAVLCRVHSHTLHSMTMVMVMLVLVDAFASSINSLQSINYVK